MIDTPKRLGILGGTFDPIHLGHLIIASYAADALALDAVWFMPAQTPPHKLGKDISPVEHRMEMVKLAIEGDNRFASSDFDVQSERPSLTSELLERMAQELPGTELFFIAGADSLLDFPTWNEPQQVLHRARLAIARRSGSKIADDVFDPIPNFRERTVIFDSPIIEISSTDIRDRVREGKSIQYLVPPGLEAYIGRHGLYRENED